MSVDFVKWKIADVKSYKSTLGDRAEQKDESRRLLKMNEKPIWY